MPYGNKNLKDISNRLDKIEDLIDKTQNIAIGNKHLYQEIQSQQINIHKKELQVTRWKSISITLISSIIFILLYGTVSS